MVQTSTENRLDLLVKPFLIKVDALLLNYQGHYFRRRRKFSYH